MAEIILSHPSHKTRFSDASTFDEICEVFGATDTRSTGTLDKPCPGVVPPWRNEPVVEVIDDEPLSPCEHKNLETRCKDCGRSFG